MEKFRGRKTEIQEKSIKLNLSQREYDKLKELAKHEGLNMSAYIRQVAIHKAYNEIFNMYVCIHNKCYYMYTYMNYKSR